MFRGIRLVGFISLLIVAIVPASANPQKLPQIFGGAFQVVDHTGATRTDRDFHGKYLLLFFGYIYCPDICPTHLQNLTVALDRVGPLVEKLTPAFVTVDPGRDTPSAMKDYVGAFHPRLIGLTGDEKQIAGIAKAYRIHRVKVLQEEDDDYLVSHSSSIFLMGPDGKFVTLLPHNSPPDRIADILRKYLQVGS